MLIRFTKADVDPYRPSTFITANTFDETKITGDGVFCYVVDRPIDQIARIVGATDEVFHVMPEHTIKAIEYGDGFYSYEGDVYTMREAYVIY